ncbi:MAG: hypothetical protein GEV10_28550 [Streptosporangiales bacterium]|nr:hypothetical protein [Streptosporangiales bacterium]
MSVSSKASPVDSAVSPTAKRQRDPRGIAGILFFVFFIAGDVIRGQLANGALPMPGNPAGDVVRYHVANPLSTSLVSTVQLLAALSLLVFVPAMAARVRQVAGDGAVFSRMVPVAGVLAGASLLVSALLGFSLTAFAGSWDLGVVDTVRTLNFVTGGVSHVVALGLFVGAVALGSAKALPRGVRWYGYVAAVPAILSILSVFVYLASAFLPVGRMLGMIWCVVAGITLLVGTRRSLTPER